MGMFGQINFGFAIEKQNKLHFRMPFNPSQHQFVRVIAKALHFMVRKVTAIDGNNH
jgi:hypothetical protein